MKRPHPAYQTCAEFLAERRHRISEDRGAKLRARIDRQRQLQEGDRNDRVLQDFLGAGQGRRKQTAPQHVDHDHDGQTQRPKGADQMDRPCKFDSCAQDAPRI